MWIRKDPMLKSFRKRLHTVKHLDNDNFISHKLGFFYKFNNKKLLEWDKGGNCSIKSSYKCPQKWTPLVSKSIYTIEHVDKGLLLRRGFFPTSLLSFLHQALASLQVAPANSL